MPGAGLFGRARELDALEAWASGSTSRRLLSLTGPPGSGKSRLARELAGSRARSIVCELGACRDEGDLSRTLLAALGGAARARLDRALAASVDRLVVLDGLDQSIEVARETVRSWLATPGPRFLATSREVLGLSGEEVLTLAPLAPDAALALFAARAARAVRDVATARAIVERLDRLPLAIELAAARTALFSEREILDRLSTAGQDPALTRTVAWSVDLLAPAERDVLLACSVFCAAFAGSDAEGIAGHEAIDGLLALERKHLIRIAEPDAAGRGRVALYDAVREVARARVAGEPGRTEALAQRHVEHFAALAERAIDHPGEPEIAMLSGSLDDLLAAHRHARVGDPSRAARIALALHLVLFRRGPAGTHTEVLSSSVECATRAGDDALVASLLHARGRAHRVAGSIADATADLDRALDVARAAGAIEVEAAVLRDLGVVERLLERPSRARELLARAAKIHAALGDTRGVAIVHDDLGVVEHDLGDLPAARRSYETALALEQTCGERRFEGITLSHLGAVAHDQGDLRNARARYRQALAIHREVGDRRFESFAHGFLAALALEQGELTRAARALDDASAADESAGDADSGAWLSGVRCALAAAHDDIPEARAHLASGRGAVRSEGDAALIRALDVFEGSIELAEARRARAEHRDADADAHLRRAFAALDPPASPRPIEMRLALRVVAAWVDRGGRRSALSVAADGTFFDRDGQRVSIAHRRSLARMLAHLAARRRAAPGIGTGIEALFAVGWDGERASARSAARRVYAGICTLRTLGLGEALAQREGRYFLDSSVEIVPHPARHVTGSSAPS
jgi:tetratricopeptide (TPR) repeat protein